MTSPRLHFMRSPRCVLSQVALLVLLAASAPARVIAADLRCPGPERFNRLDRSMRSFLPPVRKVRVAGARGKLAPGASWPSALDYFVPGGSIPSTPRARARSADKSLHLDRRFARPCARSTIPSSIKPSSKADWIISRASGSAKSQRSQVRNARASWASIAFSAVMSRMAASLSSSPGCLTSSIPTASGTLSEDSASSSFSTRSGRPHQFFR